LRIAEAFTPTGKPTDRRVGALFDQIDALTRANRDQRDPERERRLVELRHLAGITLLEEAPHDPQFVTPAFHSLPGGAVPPEVGPRDLTPELLRAGILRHGCLLVRGLLDREAALSLADGIERAFHARTARSDGGSGPPGYYDELAPERPYAITERAWIEEGGGVLAVDSPRLFFDMFEAFARVGVIELVHAYLGERPGISADKCTLRKAEPHVGGVWHQDGKFLGDVRTLNLWLALSRCGDEAPGLDIVPRRMDRLLKGGPEGTFFEIHIPPESVEEAAGDTGTMRPIFEPGDALFFDELFLHQTGSDPAMPKPRYAIESWFFGPSAFPSKYVPLAA
jgi:hypothetical protein